MERKKEKLEAEREASGGRREGLPTLAGVDTLG